MIPRLNPLVQNIPEALSIYINQIVYDKKTKGERVYTFSLGEAFFEIPRFSITDDSFVKGCHYSSSKGQPKLRNKIAKMYNDYYNAQVDPDNELLISAGSKIIIYMVLQVILCDEDEALVYEPAWLSYSEQIKLARGKHIPIPVDKKIDEWEDFITPKTKVIVVNNPNNPSGYLYTKEDLEKLLFYAKKYNLFILMDEAYSDFLLQKDKFISFAAIDKSKEHCLIVNSLSKNMGLSGWRVGYAIAHPLIIHELLKLNQHLITCAPTVLQDYMADHFDDILEKTIPQARGIAIKRERVQKIIDRIGINVLKGVGTFYFMIDISSFPGSTDELVYQLLLNHNIATVPGVAYGKSTKKYIRFGIGLENLDDIEKCLLTIKKYLDLSEFNSCELHKQMKKYGIE